MNRLLGSHREKDGSSHRRQKSRDKSSDKDKKVPFQTPLYSHSFTYLAKTSVLSQSTVTSISAAFAKAHGKSRPDFATTFSTVHATITDVRTLFTMQTRPLSSDGILSLFKSDPQKKLDKEQSFKVTLAHPVRSNFAKKFRYNQSDTACMAEGIRVWTTNR
jgi:hypothetical protein